MKTGRFRFVEIRPPMKWWAPFARRPPLQVLEVEHEVPVDAQLNRGLEWWKARPSDAHDVLTKLNGIYRP